MEKSRVEAMESWEQRSQPVIIVAALAPLFATLIAGDIDNPIVVTIDFSAWLVFVGDFMVRTRIDRDYFKSGNGIFDLVIIFFTFPWYVIPRFGNSQFLSILRIARLVRLFTAAGLGRKTATVFRRLGTLGVWLALTALFSALLVLRAEPPEAGFENIGDALWWALVSFTTVGYGDLIPTTATGRFAGMLMMFAGLAALGTVAGVLGSAISSSDADRDDSIEHDILRELRELKAEVAELKRHD